MHHGSALAPLVTFRDGEYADLSDAGVALIAAGINEKGGGAADRNDPAGRLRLLEANVKVYESSAETCDGRAQRGHRRRH